MIELDLGPLYFGFNKNYLIDLNFYFKETLKSENLQNKKSQKFEILDCFLNLKSKNPKLGFIKIKETCPLDILIRENNSQEINVNPRVVTNLLRVEGASALEKARNLINKDKIEEA